MGIQLFLLIILIFLSAFFSSSETVLYLTNEYYFSDKSKNYQKYYFIKKNQELILPLILFSNTVVNIFIGLLTEDIGYKIFPAETNIFIVISLSTLFLLLFGEIFPKKIGISFHKYIYTFNFIILYYYNYLMKNINKIISFVIRPFIKIVKEKSEVDLEEVKVILNDSYKNKLINYFQYKMFLNIIYLNNSLVKDIMIPYKYVTYINYSFHLDKILEIFLKEYNFSIPVFDPEQNIIFGYIDKREVNNFIFENYNSIDNLKRIYYKLENKEKFISDIINKHLKKPKVIYEKCSIKKLLDIFFVEGEEIVFIIDEYFQLSGVVYSYYFIDKIISLNFDIK